MRQRLVTNPKDEFSNFATFVVRLVQTVFTGMGYEHVSVQTVRPEKSIWIDSLTANSGTFDAPDRLQFQESDAASWFGADHLLLKFSEVHPNDRKVATKPFFEVQIPFTDSFLQLSSSRKRK